MNDPTVLVAGGGSGGHISPGLAIAEALDGQATCRFACSQRAIDSSMLTQARCRFTPLPAVPPSIRPLALWRFLAAHHSSRRITRQLIADEHIELVILLGGFVSVPVEAAARRCSVPTLLVNLDRVPGRANRWIAPHATRVVSAVETIDPFGDAVVGMPIRSAAVPPGDARTCRDRLGLEPDTPVLLVTGASQGAGTINDVVPALAQANPDLFRGWQVLHLSGADAQDTVRAAWTRTCIPARVEGFLHDMGTAWGAADLVISRAGAGSVAEITAAGVPAIYLPYPHHRDKHQWHNAMPAVDLGAAAIVEDHGDQAATMPALLTTLERLLAKEGSLAAMRQASDAMPRPSAAHEVAATALGMLKK